MERKKQIDNLNIKKHLCINYNIWREKNLLCHFMSYINVWKNWMYVHKAGKEERVLISTHCIVYNLLGIQESYSEIKVCDGNSQSLMRNA